MDRIYAFGQKRLGHKRPPKSHNFPSAAGGTSHLWPNIRHRCGGIERISVCQLWRTCSWHFCTNSMVFPDFLSTLYPLLLLVDSCVLFHGNVSKIHIWESLVALKDHVLHIKGSERECKAFKGDLVVFSSTDIRAHDTRKGERYTLHRQHQIVRSPTATNDDFHGRCGGSPRRKAHASTRCGRSPHRRPDFAQYCRVPQRGVSRGNGGALP
jgi:hypothetical protein